MSKIKTAERESLICVSAGFSTFRAPQSTVRIFSNCEEEFYCNAISNFDEVLLIKPLSNSAIKPIGMKFLTVYGDRKPVWRCVGEFFRLAAVCWRFPSFSCLQPVHLCQVRPADYKGLLSRSNNHTKPLNTWKTKHGEGLTSKSFIIISPSQSVLCGYHQFQFLIFTLSQSW